jgi:glycine/D-amino acid oxidase-like deaminating enzyme
MQATANVVIIGAGVIGCSTAYNLVRSGIRDVAVVEMGQVGSGTSSKSAAMLSMQFNQDELSVRMAKYSYERYMAFEEELGVPIDFHKIGWLYVATEKSAAELKEQAEFLQAMDVRTELLGPEDIKDRVPELNTSDIVLGTWGPDDGTIDPHMIMSGYVKRARELGATLYEGVRAIDILVKRGRVTSVVTNQGLIATNTVVNAAGPWAAQVSNWVGFSLPLRNATRSIVVTTPIPAIPRDRPFVEDLSVEWYFRPELDGILMGMGITPVQDPVAELDQDQVSAIIETAVHRVPILAQASLLSAWTGVRPLSPDGHAFVGPITEIEGFIFNCGWGGVGIIMAPMAGQLIAESILHGEMEQDIRSALNPARFGAGTDRISS